MKIKLLSLLVLPFMLCARIPEGKSKTFQISYDVAIIGDSIYMEQPYVTYANQPVLCQCGKRAVSIVVTKGKVSGICLDHEEYKATNPELPDNWCVSCGSIKGAKNIADGQVLEKEKK